jgi:hypothetical protein
LLKHGSHVDQLDNSNQNPLSILQARPGAGFQGLEHISLKCIAAKVICSHKIPFSLQDLPRELVHFVEIHRPTESEGRSQSPRSRAHRAPRLN